MLRLFSVVAGFLVIFTSGIVLAQGEDEVLQAILEQALKREEVFQCYRAEVDAKWYREGEGNPYHEEATYLVRDGQKYFYSESDERYVWAYDAKVAKSYHQSQGSIYGNVWTDAAEHLSKLGPSSPECLGPTKFWHEGVSALLQSFEREVQGDGRSAMVSREVSVKGHEVLDGRECTVVEVVHKIEGRHIETLCFHFADEMAFTPVRIECFNVRGGKGVVRYSYTMSDFAEVTPGIYVPAKGEYNSKAEGKDVKMLAAMEINLLETVDQSIFELTFPEGTRVLDTISGVEYVVGDGLAPPEVTESLSDPGDVTEGAQEAPAQEIPNEVVPSEPAPPAEPVPAPEPAEIPEQIPPRLEIHGAILAVLVAVCCVAAVMIAKRKRRNT